MSDLATSYSPAADDHTSYITNSESHLCVPSPWHPPHMLPEAGSLTLPAFFLSFLPTSIQPWQPSGSMWFFPLPLGGAHSAVTAWDTSHSHSTSFLLVCHWNQECPCCAPPKCPYFPLCPSYPIVMFC